MSIEHHGILGLTFGDLTTLAAQRWPDATALVDGPRSVTFRELKRGAYAVAQELIARGVGHRDHVVIVGPHCAEQVTIILGVSLIGAVFVPLDPELPDMRLAALIADAHPRVVVSPDPVGALGSGARWLPWQAIDRCIAAAREAQQSAAPRVERTPQPDDVAYMFFTSGTSGQPKAVQIEHRALLTFFETYNAAIGIRAGDRCLNTGSFHFDVCLLDLFLPLWFGATVYLGPRLPLPALFLRAIASCRITHFYAVGTWLSQITGDGCVLDQYDLRSLKVLQTGAEVCKPWVVNQWLERLPQLRFVNSYGPTEATVGCLQYAQSSPGPVRTERCAIGKPHAGSRVKLVDSRLGVIDAPLAVGELLLGGAQLMRGYWNAPERTRKAFVTIEGERYYRSGDLAYRDAQGDYWFVGRKDDQIKFLGHRFHLRELQHALALHPDVCSAVAGVVHDGRGHEQLALIGEILRPASVALAVDLRAHLRRRLPRYMVPAALGLLRSWPRSSSGKADARSCLAELGQAVAHTGRGDYVRGPLGFECLTRPGPLHLSKPQKPTSQVP